MPWMKNEGVSNMDACHRRNLGRSSLRCKCCSMCDDCCCAGREPARKVARMPASAAFTERREHLTVNRRAEGAMLSIMQRAPRSMIKCMPPWC